MLDQNGRTIYPNAIDKNGNRIHATIKRAEKEIDDFFKTNWGNRGFAMTSRAERLEDNIISPNPFD